MHIFLHSLKDYVITAENSNSKTITFRCKNFINTDKIKTIRKCILKQNIDISGKKSATQLNRRWEGSEFPNYCHPVV